MRRLDRRVLGALALVVLGAAAVGVSLVLTPTPDTVVILPNGDIGRADVGTHPVDYAIIILRVAGIPALIAGAYLTYRSRRPDEVRGGEDLPGSAYDRYDRVPLEAGDPMNRGMENQGQFPY